MPLRSSSSPVEVAVEKTTNECNVSEDWQQIMDLCDAIKTGTYSPKDALKVIMKRVQHRVPHVSIQALALLGACVNNCGKPFHLEICSRDWTSEARHIVFKAHPKVSEKLKELIKQWTSDFKDDPQLSLMGKLYSRLQSDGAEFAAKDGIVVAGATSSKQKDELGFKEDLDLAIAMSLQDSDGHPKAASSSLYPSMVTPSASSAPVAQSQSVLKRVKALYDFEAAEDNELSFKTGELIAVLDDSDENWWKGENHRGVGLFPANFVTSDLSPPKQVEKKQVRFVDQVTVPANAGARPKPEISEEKLDLCMSMLKNASPTEEDDEEETIQILEGSCRDMKPLLQQKITETDKQTLSLEEIQEKFSQALSMYQSLMKEPIPTPMVVPPSYATSQQAFQPSGMHPPGGYGHPAAGYAQMAAYPPTYDHAVPNRYPASSVMAGTQLPSNYQLYPDQGPVPGGIVPNQGSPVTSSIYRSSGLQQQQQQQQQQFHQPIQDPQQQQQAVYYAAAQQQPGMETAYSASGQQGPAYGYAAGNGAPPQMYPVYQ